MSTVNSPPASSAEYTSAIAGCLTDVLAPTQLEVVDESAAHAGHAGANVDGFGTHIRVRISSEAFAGLSRIQSYRLVYGAVQNFIDQGLHALAIEILKPP